jgi:hypothetical protein
MKVVQERYQKYLEATPLMRLSMTFPEEDEESDENYAKVRSVITEMLLKAIPKDLASEIITKRFEDPMKILLVIMIKYQPGGRKERGALLQQITYPEACWKEDKALEGIREWRRRIERAKELKLVVPDPSVMLSALDAITEKVMKKDSRRTFRLESIREEIKADLIPTYETVGKLTTVIEAELEECVNVNATEGQQAKVKSVNPKDDKMAKEKTTTRENQKKARERMIPKEKEKREKVNLASSSHQMKVVVLAKHAKDIIEC